MYALCLLVLIFYGLLFSSIISSTSPSVLIIITRQRLQTMLQAYDRLKDILANQSYESSLSFVESLPVLTARDQLLKTNFYCFLTIQRGFKITQSLTILQNCLADPQCKGSIRALTRYHIAQVHFIEDLRACGEECEQIVAEFIGNYHMLKEHCERSQPEEDELVMLGYIIYYCLLMLGYVRGQQGRKEESENYVAASVNLLKVNNQSSQFINASNFRTKSSERQHRLDNKTY